LGERKLGPGGGADYPYPKTLRPSRRVGGRELHGWNRRSYDLEMAGDFQKKEKKESREGEGYRNSHPKSQFTQTFSRGNSLSGGTVKGGGGVSRKRGGVPALSEVHGGKKTQAGGKLLEKKNGG